jgi:hypothetical protein
MLPEMGEHQLIISDYLRHSDLHVTNKYLQAATKSKRLAQGEASGCDPAGWRTVGKQINPNQLIRAIRFSRLSDGEKGESTDAETLIGPKRTQISFRGSM